MGESKEGVPAWSVERWHRAVDLLHAVEDTRGKVRWFGKSSREIVIGKSVASASEKSISIKVEEDWICHLKRTTNHSEPTTSWPLVAEYRHPKLRHLQRL